MRFLRLDVVNRRRYTDMGSSVYAILCRTHGFKKGGNKTPKQEIERAESYKRDFARR